jgi:hypothetical protein
MGEWALVLEVCKLGRTAGIGFGWEEKSRTHRFMIDGSEFRKREERKNYFLKTPF